MELKYLGTENDAHLMDQLLCPPVYTKKAETISFNFQDVSQQLQSKRAADLKQWDKWSILTDLACMALSYKYFARLPLIARIAANFGLHSMVKLGAHAFIWRYRHTELAMRKTDLENTLKSQLKTAFQPLKSGCTDTRIRHMEAGIRVQDPVVQPVLFKALKEALGEPSDRIKVSRLEKIAVRYSPWFLVGAFFAAIKLYFSYGPLVSPKRMALAAASLGSLGCFAYLWVKGVIGLAEKIEESIGGSPSKFIEMGQEMQQLGLGLVMRAVTTPRFPAQDIAPDVNKLLQSRDVRHDDSVSIMHIISLAQMVLRFAPGDPRIIGLVQIGLSWLLRNGLEDAIKNRFPEGEDNPTLVEQIRTHLTRVYHKKVTEELAGVSQDGDILKANLIYRIEQGLRYLKLNKIAKAVVSDLQKLPV